MTPDPQVISLQDVKGLIERLEEESSYENIFHEQRVNMPAELRDEAASALRSLQARVQELERGRSEIIEAVAYVHGQYVIDRDVARALLASKTTIIPQDPTP